MPRIRTAGDQGIGRDHLGQRPVARPRLEQRLDLRGKPRHSVADPSWCRAGTGQRTVNKLLHGKLAPLDDRDLVQHAERRAEQNRLVADPDAGASLHMGLVVLGVALHQRPIGRDPIDVRRVAVPAVEQRHGTARFDQAIQPPQRFGAVHPLERTAHGDQMEPPQRRRQIEGAATDEADPAGVAELRFGDAQHLRLGSMAITSPASRAKAPASIPGPHPRSSTRSSSFRPVKPATWRIRRGAYAGRPAR